MTRGAEREALAWAEALAAGQNPLAALVERAAALWPQTVAFTDDSPAAPRLDFAGLARAVATVAGALARRGIAPGDAVLLAAGNDLRFVASWLGIVRTGAVVVPLPIVSAAVEIAQRAELTRARLLLHDEARAAVACEAARLAGAALATLSLAEIDANAAGALESPAPVDADAPAMILFTSGTTGTPRGAVISHRTLVLHTSLLARTVIGLGPADRILGVLPLSHSYGARMVMLATLVAGASTLLVARFDAPATLAQMVADGTTWVPAVPTMFAAWGALPAGPRPPLRWCLSAGSPLADETLRRAAARLGTTIRQAYGMTEATLATLDAPPHPRTIGTVGRVVPGIEITIVDALGNAVAAGEPGEVLIRGHNLMSGYLDDPAATREALRCGWMHSGDIGSLDASGLVRVVDRIKDMIIRGGNNVYPAEVEAVLATHPALREVAVVGRPDPYYGEEIVAFVVPADPAAPPDPAELATFARARLGRSKVPREWHLVDAFPLGPSRKVLKRELRARLATRS